MIKKRLKKKRDRRSEKLRGTNSVQYDWFKVLLNIKEDDEDE